MADKNTRAVVLLSGGIDSSTTLAIAANRGYKLHAVTFHYGQKADLEVESAKKVAEFFDVSQHVVLPLALGQLGHSALTDDQVLVPENSPARTPSSKNEIPPTYVPARNTVFLAYALAIAEITDSSYIFIGVTSVDYSGYPDCRPEYVEAAQNLARFATKQALEKHPPKIETPLLSMSKADIIRWGLSLDVDYSVTLSCYKPDERGRACGRCDSCRLRLEAFRQAGLEDHAPYQNGVGK
ncbi:MAG: 7-cyano-7-deazaguanine synthase QueC [Candidatus Brocadiia bacterium]